MRAKTSEATIATAHSAARTRCHPADGLGAPTATNAIGAKGCGEAGATGAPPALVLAALDALRPLGVARLDMPLTRESLWRAIARA